MKGKIVTRPTHKLFFSKGRSSKPVQLPGEFVDLDTAITRATQHLDLLAGIGVKGATAIITTDEDFTSVDDCGNAYQIRRFGSEILEVETDDFNDSEGE